MFIDNRPDQSEKCTELPIIESKVEVVETGKSEFDRPKFGEWANI